MTDGILLAELQRDRQLRRYDTIIIDEAHERSLNIDFLLGYLKQLLPRRPDLKLVITSATIDPERFARHFGEVSAGASTDQVGRHRSSRSPDGPTRSRSATARSWSRRARPTRRSMRRGEARPRPDRGDHRRRPGAVGRGPGRRPGLPARRARDPRHRRRPGRPVAGRARPHPRDRAALLPALGRRAAPRLLLPPVDGPPRRARHERRRDLADRPRHPLRRGHRAGAHLAVLPEDQGAAAPDRGDQPGVGPAAVGALRPRRGGRGDPAVRRGRLRGAARRSPTPRSCAPTSPR